MEKYYEGGIEMKKRAKPYTTEKGFKKYLRKEGIDDWEMDMLILLRRSIQEESK